MDDKQTLRQSAVDLQALATILNKLAEITPEGTNGGGVVDISDLEPDTALDGLADRIRANTPITDDEYAALCDAARRDIVSHSRLNGLLENVARIATFVRTGLLPLFLGG